MIVYFLEDNKLYTFRLPKEIKGNYVLSDYDSNGNKRIILNIEGINGKWIAHDNDNTKIIGKDGFYAKDVELPEYSFYNLVIYGSEKIILYTSPMNDNSFERYTLKEGDTITISGNGAISYDALDKEKMEITYKNGLISFENNSKKVISYLNNTKVYKTNISTFDQLFILGLRILFIGNSIFINSIGGHVIVDKLKFSNEETETYPDYKANSDVYKDFYDEKDYYYRTPIFLSTLEPLKTNISLPPQKNENRRDPLFMTIIPSIAMCASSILMGFFAFTNKGEDWQNSIGTIVMCAAMLFAGIVWPFIERGYEKFVDMTTERRRSSRYKKYLKEKDAIFIEAIDKQKNALIDRYLTIDSLIDAVLNKSYYIFSRNYNSEIFLNVILGYGDVPLLSNVSFEKEEYSEIDDKLIDKAEDLINKHSKIANSPYTISIMDKKMLAFIGDDSIKYQYLNSILLQILAYHSYYDLKIIVLTDHAYPTSFSYLKESKFCFSDDMKTRFFCEDYEEGIAISSYLHKIFMDRLQSKKENNNIFRPYYLILSDNISIYRNLEIIRKIGEYDNLGFGVILFDNKINNAPEGCNDFVYYNTKEVSYFSTNMSKENVKKFTPSFAINPSLISKCIATISNIPIRNQNNESLALTENLGFLEMYGVGKVEQLNILDKWSNSNIATSLGVPVGVSADGNILNLDLHEMKHGPHGLIAGMTGSGKSEFIITYILSLAINYSPLEVQFVLIDYKGGGLAGAFENRTTGVKLPHLIGTITNLDKSEMKRSLVSIKSELQRRQKLFNEAKEQLNTGTIDIYKYQRLYREKKLSKPLSHLFIICDEFAELKAAQPDFMDELISTARIGRSLGVHLILATQKPSGVVDDQIWSNSKFKVCCKVQTPDDSNEMIHRSDAAYIKETGRFYLQVGYDEYFVLGQSAYSGRLYYPSDKLKSSVTTDISFLDNYGNVLKTSNSNNQQSKENNGEELVNILNYIISTAKELGYQNQMLWLPNIPPKIVFGDTYNKYKPVSYPYKMTSLIGEYDDPSNQSQGAAILDINEMGNIFIMGTTGSGKSTILSTIIYSLILFHSPEEVNFFLIDFGNESLSKFRNAPQVSEIITSQESQKLERCLHYLSKEIEKRKKHYSYNGGSFANEVKNGKCSFPNLIVMINGLDVFKEKYEDLYDDIFVSLTRECTKVGIYFIVTGLNDGSLGYFASDNFGVKIPLHMADESDYLMLFPGCKIIPNNNPGRGIIKYNDFYEFQSDLMFEEDVLDKYLEITIQRLNQIYPNKASKLPTLPNIVKISSLNSPVISLSSMPIGLEVKSACPYNYDFTDYINLISYGRENSISFFLNALLYLFSYLPNTKNIVLSGNKFFNLENTSDNVKFYNDNFKTITSVLSDNFKKINDPNAMYIVTIVGYTLVNKHLKELKKNDNTVITIDELIINNQNSKNIKFILIDNMSIFRSADNYSWYSLIENSKGILISGSPDDQELFTFKNDYSSDEEVGRNDGVVFENESKIYIKYINK